MAFGSSKLLVDPVRPRIYAVVPASSSVAVINTNTFKVVAMVPTGPKPLDLAISRDGDTLYVANGGSADNAVAVLDLNSLVLRTSFALPRAAQTVATGLDGRVYVAISDPPFTVFQLNGTTGQVQTVLPNIRSDSDILRVSPDGDTLYAYGALMQSFDVSTQTPSEKQWVANDNGQIPGSGD